MTAHTFLFYIVGKTVVSRTRKGFDLMKCEWKEKPHVLSSWTVMSLRYGACRMFCMRLLLLRLHLSAAASESASNLAVWTCLEHGAASCERVMLQVYFVVNEIIKKSITKRPSANDSGIITACSWFCLFMMLQKEIRHVSLINSYARTVATFLVIFYTIF